MSEAILKALMQLFALISDIHDDTVITAREKSIVRIFLVRHLNNELVSKYMQLFEDYLSIFNSERIVKGSLQDRKRISLNAMKILSICETINAELEQRQKVFVMVRLTDYVFSGSEISETELDFLQTVSSAFNIPDKEFSDIRVFIFSDDPAEGGSSNILIISDKAEQNKGIKMMFDENLKGAISFLHVPSTNTYLMRYTGTGVLYLNGQNILEGETYFFDTGSSIRGSGIKAIYYSEIVRVVTSTAFTKGASLEAENVTYRFGKSSNGIHNMNFIGKSGELVGILGGSGVGKSTTLSIMSGTMRPQEGRIMINGYDLYNDGDRESLRGVIGFVPQDDLLIEELTVYQNLYYNAKMCLSNLSGNELSDAVDIIIDGLDLNEARDLKVGNPLNKVISGGQRKRINIALELMREPTILFVDEPTSGLSSVDSEMVMYLLKDLTYKGKLVIVNIHQPSSEIFKMFDKIMIIDRGGYQVYFGNPSEAIIYFKLQTNHANPDEDQCTKCGNVDTEQILQIIEAKVVDEHGRATRTRKVTPAEWARRFIQFHPSFSGGKREKKPLPENSYSIPGLLRQTLIFFSRDLLSKIADRQYIVISILGPPLLALMLSYFIKSPVENYTFNENENIPAYLFMCVITAMFFGLMGSSEEIVSDRKILQRESFLNLSWFSYLNSKVLIMFLLSAIQTISFVLVGNCILEIEGMTLSYWMVLFTTSCFANILGLNLSSAFRSVITIYVLIPFIIIPQLLFSGVLVKFDKLHTSSATQEYTPIIGDIMIARWSFEALAVEQFRNNQFERIFFDHDSEISKNDWYANFLIQKLKIKVLFNFKYRDDDGSHEEELRNNRMKINKYMSELSSVTGLDLPEMVIAGEDGRIDSATARHLTGKLDRMRQIFLDRKNRADSLKDAESGILQKRIGRDRLAEMKARYTNERLTSLVKDYEAKDLILETKDGFLRKYEPGFMKAESPSGRAHFYAPAKTLGSREIDTFVFNLAVVWGISAILYVALYFNLFEKVVTFFGKLKVRIGD